MKEEEEEEIAATSGKVDGEEPAAGEPAAKAAERESADASAQTKIAAHAVGTDEAANAAALAVGGNAADEDKDNNPGGDSAKEPPPGESSLAAGRTTNGVGADAERGGKDASTTETPTATKPKVCEISCTEATLGGPIRAPRAPVFSDHVSDKEGNAAQIRHQGVHDDDSSDDDGDGFRIVVGREREAAPAPTAPVKRFLRGEVLAEWQTFFRWPRTRHQHFMPVPLSMLKAIVEILRLASKVGRNGAGKGCNGGRFEQPLV